jgi:hypothetical protein
MALAPLGELVFDSGMREIDRDIRILRAVRDHGTRYFDLLHLKVGNTVEVASAAQRLERAGFLVLDDSRPLEITQGATTHSGGSRTRWRRRRRCASSSTAANQTVAEALWARLDPA